MLSHASLSLSLSPVLTHPPLKLRLVNGQSPNQGEIEIFYGGEWGFVCGSSWTHSNAKVACKQLGYSGAMDVNADLLSDTNTPWYWLEDVQCHGNESRISDCSLSEIGVANCGGSSPATVVCNSKSFISNRYSGSTVWDPALHHQFLGRGGA